MSTYNPADYTVEQVNEYLDDHPDEAADVLAAEAASDKPRVGITEGPHAASDADSGTSPQASSTDPANGGGTPNPLGTPEHVDQVMSLEEANAKALSGNEAVTDNDDVQDKGYFGTSPSVLATGLPDSGLSLPTVLQGADGQVTAPPQMIDREDVHGTPPAPQE